MSDRSVFFVSDGTGITAETLGNAIMAQFAVKARHIRRPFIDTVDKGFQLVREVNGVAEREGKRPIVFTTFANRDVLDIVRTCQGKVFDLIKTFVEPLEEEFGLPSNHKVGRFSDVSKDSEYNSRIDAITPAILQETFRKYMPLDRYTVVTLVPAPTPAAP